jgi:hypothetical protein
MVFYLSPQSFKIIRALLFTKTPSDEDQYQQYQHYLRLAADVINIISSTVLLNCSFVLVLITICSSLAQASIIKCNQLQHQRSN